MVESWTPYIPPVWIMHILYGGFYGNHVFLDPQILKSFDNCIVLTLRLTGAASCRSRKGIWRLTTISTPEMLDFTFLGPHHSLQWQAPFLVHFWNWTRDSSNKLPPRGTVEDLPPDSPSVRLMIFLDGLQGKAAGCLATPKQQPGSKLSKPRVLWIGEDV